jgi:hypothetical protein
MLLDQILKENLLEMPYAPEDQYGKPAQLKMDTSNFDHFYSDRTLAEEFKLVEDTQSFVVYLRQDHTGAFIGKRGTRPNDNVAGAAVYITLDFKEQMISNSNPGMKLPGAVQVDLVVVNDAKLARGGYGAQLYISLVTKLGLSIISDNTQYKGGKELWKKLAAGQKGYIINIIEDGVVRMDGNQPFVYNGTNLPDDELWSARPLPRTQPSGLTPAGVQAWEAKQAELAKIPDKTMTLFVMRKA